MRVRHRRTSSDETGGYEYPDFVVDGMQWNGSDQERKTETQPCSKDNRKIGRRWQLVDTVRQGWWIEVWARHISSCVIDHPLYDSLRKILAQLGFIEEEVLELVGRREPIGAAVSEVGGHHLESDGLPSPTH